MRTGILLLVATCALIPLACAAPTSEKASARKRARPSEPEVLLSAPGERTITVEADRDLGACYRFWTIGNFNKPHLVLDAEGLKAYRASVPFVTGLNFVYFLGGRWEGENEWFLGTNDDGTIRTDFTGMIAQLKAAENAGLAVRIVLDNVPARMSDPPQRNHYGNTAPAGDLRLWHQYVASAVRAMVKAFGREKVGSWTFRVGTEPDLKPAHWAGTREEYFAHYDFTVDAVRSVLPEAKVGPGNILNPNWRPRRRGREHWGLDIIDHVATGKNACTGKIGAPIDFFQCSWYARVGQPVSRFDKAVGIMRERLATYPQLKHVVIEIGEFAVLRDDRGRRLYAGDTTEWSASFMAALADRVYALDVRELYEWDHATGGILHPKGHVIWMLEQMAGGRRAAVSVEGESAANCGAVASRKGDELLVMLYNHRPKRRAEVREDVHLVIKDARMKAGMSWRLSEWTVDRQKTVWAYAFDADARAAGLERLPGAGRYEGNPVKLYGERGSEVFRANAKKYARIARLPMTKDNVRTAAGDGQITLDIEMAGHSVRLIRLTPLGVLESE